MNTEQKTRELTTKAINALGALADNYGVDWADEESVFITAKNGFFSAGLVYAMKMNGFDLVGVDVRGYNKNPYALFAIRGAQ